MIFRNLVKLNQIEKGLQFDSDIKNLKDSYDELKDAVAGKCSCSNDYTDVDKAKVGHITVTGEVDLNVLSGKAHVHGNRELLDAYTQTEGDLAGAVKSAHAHGNTAVLNLLTNKKGNLCYDGMPLISRKDAIKFALIL